MVFDKTSLGSNQQSVVLRLDLLSPTNTMHDHYRYCGTRLKNDRALL